MKKIIVTGANGFVGRWLSNELAQHGYYVYALDITKPDDFVYEDNVKSIICDVTKIENMKTQFEKENITAIIHLAWIGSGGPKRADYKTQLLNVEIACNIAKFASEIGVKHLYAAGTISEQIVDNIILQDNVSPNMMYAICKKTTRYMLDVYCRMIDLKFTWLQFSNIYGPYNYSGNLLSYALEKLANGEEPEFSAGTQPYDFIYIKDLVRAIRLLCDIDCNKKIYFLGSGNSRELHEYLEELPIIYGNNSSVGIGKRPEDGVKYFWEWFDIADLKEDTGFDVEYTFAEGVKETIQWLEKK